jgi:hypothetical protein
LGCSRPTYWARVVATLLVAVPTLGICAASLVQAISTVAAPVEDRLFHLVFATALVVVLSAFVVTISGSRSSASALAAGAVGCALALGLAVVVEVLGPPALLALVALASAWSLVIALAGRTGHWRASN